MAKIEIISGNHLCHNPRVLKEADTLFAAGFDVEVLGAWHTASLAQRDAELAKSREWSYVPVVDMTGTGVTGRMQRVLKSARAQVGRACFKRLGKENVHQLGYAGPELLKAARARRADLYIAHSEQAMWVAARLLDEGFKVGVDMEDWFSEDLLPHMRDTRPLKLLRSLERRLLATGAHRACTSRAMSSALAERYNCEPPSVIYNVFPWSDRENLDGVVKDRHDARFPSVHWYSQTLGPGRGLEDLFKALPLLDREVEIHLRGRPVNGWEAWLAGRVGLEWRRKIHVHPLVSNRELLSRIAEHDIGFAGELNHSLSRDLTVTNKLFHYLLAGLAVVASATTGQKEVLEKAAGAGLLYPCGDARALAGALNSMLASPARLEAAKASALKSARELFCWENEKRRLLCSVRAALGNGGAGLDA